MRPGPGRNPGLHISRNSELMFGYLMRINQNLNSIHMQINIFFVGFNDSVRSVKYYKIRTHNILESRNAKFNMDDEQIEVPIQDLLRSNSNWEENIENTTTTEGEEELEDDFCSITPTPNSHNSVMPSLDTTLIAPSPEPESLPTHRMNTRGNQYNYRELNDPYRDIDSMDTANFIAAMLIDQEIPASTKLVIDMEVQQV